MSKLMQYLFRRLEDVAGDGTDGSGGGGAVDRGDAMGTTAAAAATATDEAPADQSAETTDEQPRDDKGRYTGKGVIPMDRHEAVLGKERAAREIAERQLAELQQQMADVNKNADVEKLQEHIAELRKQERRAIMSGDEDKSIALSAEIDRIRDQINISQNQHLTARAKEEAREEIRVDLAVERLQEIYPQLDETSDKFDQDTVDETLALQRFYMAEHRLSPSKALMKAAERVMKDRQPPAAADDKGKSGLAAAQKSAADRKTAAVQKNIDASSRQPTSLKDVGMDYDKAGQTTDVDVSNMSYADFEALPESTKARMRGDML